LREVTELSLEAVSLDAEILIEPKPETASVFIDGVLVGSGAWQGFLPSGLHRIEALAPGYLPFRHQVRLAPGRRTSVGATLSANVSPRPAPLTGLFVEGAFGPALSNTLGGALDDDCDCSRYSMPFGWLALLRAGYSAKLPFAVELSGGWSWLSQGATGHAVGIADWDARYTSDDYRDEVEVSGPFGTIGGSVRGGRRFPVTARLGIGVARLRVEPSSAGTFEGTAVIDGDPHDVSSSLGALEATQVTWAPLISTELRVGYRLSRRVSMDAGMSLNLFAASPIMRGERYLVLPESEPASRSVGAIVLDDARAMSAFVILSPSVALRVEL
jgi:hypothetical protein